MERKSKDWYSNQRKNIVLIKIFFVVVMNENIIKPRWFIKRVNLIWQVDLLIEYFTEHKIIINKIFTKVQVINKELYEERHILLDKWSKREEQCILYKKLIG